jgi:hypothetical protein
MVDKVDFRSLPSPDDPKAALAAVVALRRLAEQLEAAAVDAALEEGWTWAQIAEELNVTKQGAHKRHAARIGPKKPRGGKR